MDKILFIDRDGTILKEPPVDFQVDRLDKFEFVPGVISALRRIATETDYRLVMVSNQDGLGTPSFPTEDFQPLQDLMLRTLEGEGVVFDEVLIDPSFPSENSPRRKPATGMVEKYMNRYLDCDNSYVIGDRLTDMQLAANMGIKGIFLGDGDCGELPVAFQTTAWDRIASFIRQGSRCVRVVRKTSETEISVELDLNGEGRGKIKTGLPFFDHMLDQIARHGGVDLSVAVSGDLEVDEHHSVEDTGIALGECFARALGQKKGIGRYGFALPMDESEAKVLLDLGGRTCLVWEVEFTREYVGDFPTEMTRHFFDSFCQGCRCNLHIAARGENNHHLLEAIFKAFARSMKDAVRQTGTAIPSSKGSI